MSIKTESRDIAKLYSAIPSFSCKPGCSDCCGPVPMARAEWQQVKLSKRNAGQDCMTCDFLVDDKCSVYSNRPFLCRLFGATKEAAMACPHGCGPALPLNKAQTELLVKRYQKIVGPVPPAYTANVQRVMAHVGAGPTKTASVAATAISGLLK